MAEEKTPLRTFLENMTTSVETRKKVLCKNCKKEHIIVEEFTAPFGRLMRIVKNPGMNMVANAAVSNDPTSIRKFSTNKIYDPHLMGLISKFEESKFYEYVFEYWYSNTKKKQGKTFVVKLKTKMPILGFFCEKDFSEDADTDVIVALAATQNVMYDLKDAVGAKLKKIDVQLGSMLDMAKEISTEIQDLQYEKD